MASSSPLEPDTLPVYNILLLGESGVGKTTFINSFVNYIAHETLAEAQKNPVPVVIPVKFEITDDNDQFYVIEEGDKDDNESLGDTAHSSTVQCKSYLINFGKFHVRLIDSAGVGSTVTETESNRGKIDKHQEGVEQDKKYVDNVLNYIKQFHHLHAIVIVVKSNETRCNTRFELSLKQLLTSFNKTAINNLFFIVTFGDSTRYKFDVVKGPLKTLLGNVIQPSSGELLTKNKVYSVDSKGFRYLLAVKHGATFDKDETKNCLKAWKISQAECRRLIDYITGQGAEPKPDPHRVTETLSIKEARDFITIVEEVIEKILKVIDQNKHTLKECLASSSKEDEQIAVFKDRLNERQQDVEIVKAELPQTVCKSSKCAKVYTVDGKEKTHYSNICCKGCRVPISRRLFCTAFELVSGTCKVCKCHVKEHRRIYFTTTIVSKFTKDKDAIIKDMASATDNRMKIEKLKKYVEMKQHMIETERIVIENAQRIFKNFLKTNPIIPSEGGSGGAELTILPDEVFAVINQLLGLEVFGPAIQAAYAIAKQGEEEDWLANKFDSTKEKIINVKNSVSNWYQEQFDSASNKHINAITPISLKDD